MDEQLKIRKHRVIVIDDDIYKELNIIKFQNRLRSVNAVIRSLLKSDAISIYNTILAKGDAVTPIPVSPLSPAPACNHKDSEGKYTIELEDYRCDTDRGVQGERVYHCLQCGKEVEE